MTRMTCICCGKDARVAEATLADTTAKTRGAFRTYEVIGTIYSHNDGTRCSIEKAAVVPLNPPIVRCGVRP